MKIDTPFYLKGEHVSGTVDDPQVAEIIGVDKVAEDELPENWEGLRWQVEIKIGEDNWFWIPNKTSLQNIVAAFGRETDNWRGKKILLWTTTQNVRGQQKRVIYAKPAESSE